jgi:D-lactate dehydrogenase (cytochrome)
MARSDTVSKLQTLLGARLSTAAADLTLHGANEAHFAAMPPDAVAYPASTAEVSEIVKICAATDCPIIGWGAGTSLEGHALAVHGGVTVDFSHMNNVLRVKPEDMTVVVQPGLTRENLQTELRTTGLFFPVDPGANASIGGMASTRASGTTAVRYGTMRANVLALEVVLADGRIIRTGSAAPKSSAGYDLTGLFVGAEGTLGLITELTLRLQGQPEAISAAICAFPSIGAAIDTVIATIQSGIPMARIEFVDALNIQAFNAYAKMSMPEAPHLMIEFHGTTAGVAEQAQRFGDLVAEFGGSDFQWASRVEDRAALWRMRHHGYYATRAFYPGTAPLTTDVCVPISKLAQAVEETAADVAASGIPGPILGHAGDGNFHVLLLPKIGDAAEWAITIALAARMSERALRLGGTVTGEHGIGMGKRSYMQAEHGDAWDVMGDIKRALDPQGLMNPGKLLRGN